MTDSGDMDWSHPVAIEIAKKITFTYGKKFRDRGPEAPEESGVAEWRGQKWRAHGQRWGNRGGKRLAEWNAFYAGKNASKGKDKSKGKGKHKGENTDNGKGFVEGKAKEKGKHNFSG